jgi:hypothetical protein
MILTLVLVKIGSAEWVERLLASLTEPIRRPTARFFRWLRVSQPSGLGIPFQKD